MTRGERFRKLLASARVANVPSVISHVVAGAAIASWSAGLHPVDVSATLLAAVSACLLLISGNLLNDWRDRAWDASRYPERALPSGAVRPFVCLAAGMAAAVMGLASALLASPWAGGIALLILAGSLVYTWVHKAARWSVVLVAGCRALLPWMGAAATAPFPAREIPPALGVLSAMLAGYVVSLSLGARREAAAPAMRKRVSVMLACLPLVDLLVLAPFVVFRWKSVSFSAADFALLLVPISAWMAARALQRVASAT